MNAIRTQKRRRNARPTLEHLDVRIVPTAVSAAVLAAELRVEARHVHHWQAALTVAAPGSHHEQVLLNHIARTEQRMAAQSVMLARIDANALAHRASPMYRLQGQPPTHIVPSPVIQPYTGTASPMYRLQGQPPTHTVPTPVIEPYSVTAPAATTTDSGSTPSLPPNASPVLGVIYDAYISNPSDFPANLPAIDAANKVVISGTNVGIQVHDSNPADFNALLAQLQSAGMQVLSSSAAYGTVVGMLPIAQLPAVAALPQTPSVTAMYQPLAMSGGAA